MTGPFPFGYVPPMTNDDLAPARGIRNGILLSLPLWAGIIAAARALLS